VSIDWTHFTPWTSLGGGLLLGVAAALFILVDGRILGISSILGGLLQPRPGDTVWRIAFILGLLAAPPSLAWIVPESLIQAPRIDAGWAAVIVAGLLVGYGTRLGSGCTSGHGICGLSRLSLRSLAATMTFMAAGFAVVFIARHVL
jgi:uncharacterized membrane protein YedE/YeeE